MASPPFSLNVSVPGNADIAANYPTLDRSDKDVIQSWLLIQGNVQGRTAQAYFDKVGSTYGPGSAPTPSTAGVSAIYTDTDNTLKQYSGDISGIEPEYVGVPPGTIIDYAGATTPVGYLLCAGQAVSRSTYARLFTAIGTLWGSGDGSTTFNVPDLRGMSVFGKDNMGGTAANRITVAGGNIDGTVLGNFGFLQNITITQANLPNITLPLTSITVVDPGHHHTYNISIQQGFQSGNSGGNMMSSTSGTTTGNSTTGITLSGNVPLGGSGTIIGILPNLAIVNKCIKF